MAWTILLGDAAPELDLELEDSSAGAGAYITVDVTVDARDFVASGTTLHLGCRVPRGNDCGRLSEAFLPQRSRVHREDGLDWSEPYSPGGDNVRPIPIGEVAPGASKRVQLSFLREMVPPGSVLTVTASAWNAGAASRSLAVGEATDNGLAAPAAPANDDYSASERLEGASGETALDLALASREPGEPPLSFTRGPVAAASSRTLWYAWEAPANGLFRFGLKEAGSGNPANAAFALFTGDGLVDLELGAEKQGNEITFAADVGALYRLRISSEEWDLPPFVLEWESADSRPANDDFDFAQVIEGESGSRDASNEGATLQNREFPGGLAATVWFEWTAPDDGYWQFGANLRAGSREDSGLVARVYAGARVGELRLLSQSSAQNFAILFARQGETYRIAVASSSAEAFGRRFTLNWGPVDSSGYFETADRFADAVALDGADGSVRLSIRNYGFTVEHGEPAATGIATAWSQWTAPRDGRFTWRLDGPPFLQLTVFTGDALADLNLVGSASGGAALALDATANTRYWIAVGQSPEAAGRSQPYGYTWGPTPINDDRAGAIRISGAGGSIEAAGLVHATASPQDPADIAGTDSVWWQWSAPASGWHRFWIREHPFSTVLSVYPGNGARQATGTSERSFVANGRVEAWVPAQAGQTYDIRLSARPGVEKASTATLAWEASEAPAFLAYRGATATDYLVLDAQPQALREPTNLTMSEDGEYLFSTAANGLFAFRRDAETDELSLAYRFEIDSEGGGPSPEALRLARLWWNARHEGLNALSFRSGYSFALPGGGSSSLSHSPIAGYPANVSRQVVILIPGAASPDGRFFYAAQKSMNALQVYRVDSLTQFALVQEVSAGDTEGADSGDVDSLIVVDLRSPAGVALSPDGTHVYLVAERGLFVFSVDSSSGSLSLTGETLLDNAPGNPFYEMNRLWGAAVDHGGTVLFVSGTQNSPLGAAVAAFDVSDPSDPRHLDTLTRTHAESDLDTRRSWSHLIPFGWGSCQRILPHADLPAVDVFCGNGYYVVSWNRETAALEVADFAVAGELDRFGNTLPYSLGRGRRQFAGSPDGGRVYLASSIGAGALSDAIHSFERASAFEFDSAAPPGSSAGGGQPVTFGVGDTLSDLPTGTWTPNLSGDGSVRTSGGVVTVELDEGTYFEHGGQRYTCQSAAGCTIQDRRITSGTVVQTAAGTVPGGGVSGDHGDDRASAAEVAADSDTQGDLTAGDVDYFRVVVDAPGALEAYTTGRTDTLGRLEDGDGSELSENDDGGSGTNFRISEDVSPGTYFIRIGGFSSRTAGDYTLHVRFTESSAATSPSFAAVSGPGDQTYTVGMAIPDLTLPDASGGEGPLTYSLTPTVPGLSFNATASVRRLTGTPTATGTYDMTYTVRDVDGDTDSLTFAITVEAAAGDGQTTIFRVGDTLSDLPTGTWTPDVTSGASFFLSGGVATVELNDGGYIEEGDYRYTCRSTGGCTVRNRTVETGTINRTPAGTPATGEDEPHMLATPGTEVMLRSIRALDCASGADAYRWGQVSGPAVPLSDDRAEMPRFTVPEQANGRFAFRLEAACAGEALIDTVTIQAVPARREDVLSALVDFEDVEPADRPLSRTTLAGLLVDEEDSLARYLAAASRGLLDVRFDVLDWVTVPKRRNDYPLGGGNVVFDVIDRLSQAADLSTYDKVFPAIFPLEQGYPGCQAFLEPLGFVTPEGTFRLGAAWLSGYDMSCVRKGRHAHEYGHTFGFIHSLAIQCDTDHGIPVSTIDPKDRSSCHITNACANEDCTELQTGDSIIFGSQDPDMLGADHPEKYEDYFPLVYQSVWQAHAGWLTDRQIITTPGNHWITTLESLSPTPKAVRARVGHDHAGGVQEYWLETRLRVPKSNRLTEEACTIAVRLTLPNRYDNGVMRGSGDSGHTDTLRMYHSRKNPYGPKEFLSIRPNEPFWDPYRGIRFSLSDCIEHDDEVAVKVNVERSTLAIDPPVVATLERGYARVSVTNGGTHTINIGRTSVSGRHAEAFSIDRDGCTNLALDPGATCDIDLSGTAETLSLGWLHIPSDDELAPELAVSLLSNPAASNRNALRMEAHIHH